MSRVILAALIFCLCVTAAEAKRHARPFYRHAHLHGARSALIGIRSSGRPHAWCGWYARKHLVSSDPGPSYNLARNWAHWGAPSAPAPGAIVVWAHHVGKLIRHVAGDIWVVLSGNDGHAVRERPRSIAGHIAIRRGA